MSKRVTVYSNPGCGPCMVTKRHLTKLGIEFEEREAGEHPDVVALALARGNNQAAPIVEVRDEAGELIDIWTEHQRDRIIALAAWCG